MFSKILLKTTKEEIAENFNVTIANLVDGVTKISKMNFSSKKRHKTMLIQEKLLQVLQKMSELL